MNPLTLLETFRQLAIVRGVASSIQGPHPRQLVFPPHPCPATAAAARVYLKPSRAPADLQSGGSRRLGSSTFILSVSGEPPLCQFEPRTRRQRWGGGRGEGGNQLFRPRSQRGGEKGKGEAFEESSEQSGRV